jgi:HEAT repeat protein
MKGLDTLVRVRLALLAAVLALLSTPGEAAFVMANEGRTKVLLVATEPQTTAAFGKLTATLQQRFGVAPEDINTLSGPQATANRIEDELFRASRNLREIDTLFAVIALPLKGAGEDRTLIAADFKPDLPWTGLSSQLLEKVVGAASAGSVWLFVPECISVEQRPRSDFSPQQQVQRSPSFSSRATITFCERGRDAPGLLFTQILVEALDQAASAPTTRTPWMGANDIGFITSDALVDRLAQAAERTAGVDQMNLLQVRTASAAGGGALLRVPKPVGSASSAGIADRLQTASDREFSSMLFEAVRGGRESGPLGQQTANEFVKYVASESRDNRRSLTVQAIGDLPADVAMPALARVYRTSGTSPLVRQTSINEWQEVAPRDASLLAEAMKDPDANVRLAVVRAVAAAKDKSAAQFVRDSLVDPSSAALRAAAAAALPNVAGRDISEPALVAALKDPAETVRIEAATALGRISPSARASRKLTDLLDDEKEPRVLAAAAYATASVWPVLGVGSQGDVEELTDELLQLAKGNRDADVREAALYSLRIGKRSRTAAEVEKIVVSGDPLNVRQGAVEALGVFALPSSIGPLTTVAHDSEAPLQLRVAAVTSVGQIPDVKASGELWQLLFSNESNTTVKRAARNALEKVSVAPPQIRATLQDANAPADARLLAADIAGRTRDRSCVDALIGALGNSDPPLRTAAVKALSQFKEPGTLPLGQLKNILESRERARPEMRMAAAQVLGALGTAEARRSAQPGVTDPDDRVRAAVAAALGSPQTDSPSRAALIKLAQDPSAIVRAAAASSMGSVQNDVAFNNELKRLAADSDSAVRAAAVEALRSSQAPTRGLEVPR